MKTVNTPPPPPKTPKFENFIKIEGLLVIGGRNPITSKEKIIKQEVSPHFGRSQFNFAIFFTDWLVSLSWGRTMYKVFAAQKENVCDTPVWFIFI
jgi:hypothetical protein